MYTAQASLALIMGNITQAAPKRRNNGDVCHICSGVHAPGCKPWVGSADPRTYILLPLAHPAHNLRHRQRPYSSSHSLYLHTYPPRLTPSHLVSSHLSPLHITFSLGPLHLFFLSATSHFSLLIPSSPPGKRKKSAPLTKNILPRKKLILIGAPTAP